jgi:hypothetical protein
MDLSSLLTAVFLTSRSKRREGFEPSTIMVLQATVLSHFTTGAYLIVNLSIALQTCPTGGF